MPKPLAASVESIVNDLVARYMAPVPAGWIGLPSGERERRALYAIVGALAGLDTRRAWQMAMADDAASERALDEAASAVNAEVLWRMLTADKYRLEGRSRAQMGARTTPKIAIRSN